MPTSADDVCIGDVAGGTYSVTITGSFSANSVTVGGTLGGIQTLNVQALPANSAILSLGAGMSTIESNGVTSIASTDGVWAGVAGLSTLTNNGSLTTLQGGGTQLIELPLINNATVTISGADTRQDTNTVTTNNGTLQLDDGAHLKLSDGSTLTDSASAVAAFTVNAATGASSITGGTMTSAGTLLITTVGSPAVGSTSQLISGAIMSGTFSALQFPGAAYGLSYTSSSMTLIAGTPFTLVSRAVAATEDTPLNNVLIATLANLPSTGTITATVSWGDNGRPSAGTVNIIGSTGTITATHTYTTPGSYTIAINTNANGIVQTASSTATVGSAQAPTVTSITPAAMARGISATLDVKGSGFTGDATGSFTSLGITVTSVTFISPGEISVRVNVTAKAAPGANSLLVTTDGGTGTCTNCVTVASPKLTVSYGPRLTDVYSMAHNGLEPIVVAIHGGGWISGSRLDMAAYALAWSTKGVVVFSPDYSFGAYPAGINDLRSFMSCVHLRAANYGGDPNHIMVVGSSAGANLAGLLWDQPGVHAIASWSGPLNLPLFKTSPSHDPMFVRNLRTYEGGGDGASASPISYICPSYPPMLMFNATKETIPLSQAVSMGNALNAAGVTSQVIVLSSNLHAQAYASQMVPSTQQTVTDYTLSWMLAQP